MQPGQAGALRQSKSKRQKNTDSSSPKAVKVEIWKIEGFQKILLKKNIRKHEKYEVNTCEYNRLQWSE